jgi:hypothetical protein
MGAIEVKLRNIPWRKWGRRSIYALGAFSFFALSLSLLFVFSAFVATRMRNSKLPLVDANNVIEPAIHQNILNATVSIETDKGRARGYWLSEENLLITNHHVVTGFCPSTDCSQYRFDVRSYGTSGAIKGPWNVVRCIEWLDLCALTNSQRRTIIFPPNHRVLTRTEPFTAYMVPISDFSTSLAKLTFGKVTMSTEWWGEGKLLARWGYSGSPLFTQTGEFAGIVSRLSRPTATDSLSKGLWESLVLIFASEKEDYLTESAWVSAAAVTKVLLCDASRSDSSCIQDQLNAFIDEEWKLMVGGKISGCGPLWKRIQANSSTSSFHDEACHSLPHLFPATSEAAILKELCDSLSIRKPLGSASKLQEYLEEALWLKTYALLGLTSHFAKASDFLDDLKTRTSNVRATTFINTLRECLL